MKKTKKLSINFNFEDLNQAMLYSFLDSINEDIEMYHDMVKQGIEDDTEEQNSISRFYCWKLDTLLGTREVLRCVHDAVRFKNIQNLPAHERTKLILKK